MSFQKYPKITSSKNDAHKAYLKAVNLKNIPKGTTFEVSQKIHGSNVSVVVSADGTITTARRKDLLKADEVFFGVQEWVPRYLNWSRLAELFPKASYIQVYGEIFGGGCQPEPSKKSQTIHDKNDTTTTVMNPIQKEVFYTRKYHFQVFDIIVHYAASDTHNSFVVSPGDMRHIVHILYTEKMKTHGDPNWDALPYASKIFTGTFDQCIEFARKNLGNPWYSHVTHSHPFPDQPNEGFVIRPSAGYYTNQIKHSYSGCEVCKLEHPYIGCEICPIKHTYVSNQRMILLKMKSKKFIEKSRTNKSTNTAGDDNSYIESVKNMCTKGRIESVISKMLENERNIQNIQKICKELVADIIEDNAEIRNMNSNKFYKLVQKVCFDKLRDYFLPNAFQTTYKPPS